MEGRTGDLLSFKAPGGTFVTVLPLALGTVIEETPGVRRFQVIRSSPSAVSVRLDILPAADPVQVWHTVDQRLHAFFAAQGAAPVVVETRDRPTRPRP